ncbi:hypothetical protein ACSMXN_22010 [Jatrophihabitans sp. DSM 45814]
MSTRIVWIHPVMTDTYDRPIGDVLSRRGQRRHPHGLPESAQTTSSSMRSK